MTCSIDGKTQWRNLHLPGFFDKGDRQCAVCFFLRIAPYKAVRDVMGNERVPLLRACIIEIFV